MDLLTVVLSSSVVSGVVSALVGGWFNTRSRRMEYANSYFKIILERRLAAYEELEELIALIKVAVVDDDKKPYHLLFSKNDGHVDVYRQVVGKTANSLWLTDDLFSVTRELNVLIYGGTKDLGLIEFGKKHYSAIAELRTKLERLHARDMLVLHDVPRFLKAKKPSDGYIPLPSRDA